MSELGLLSSHQLLLWGAWLTLLAIASTATTTVGKPGCPTQCGNLMVPYPFGIGLDGSCSIGDGYNINCNTSTQPPKALYHGDNGNVEIVDISIEDANMRTKTYVASSCYEDGVLVDYNGSYMYIYNTPLVFSDTANKFMVIGCDDLGVIDGVYGQNNFTGGVISVCYTPEDVNDGSCSGNGCSETTIPKGLKGYDIDLISIYNHTNTSSFDNCSYSFLGEFDKYTFQFSDLSDPGFLDRIRESVPVVLEWTVGGNQTCDQAQKNATSYACKQNAVCRDFNVSTEGYSCSCEHGYEGNPYLGCTDIDECAGPNNPCSNICENVPGSQKCSCPKGYHGDGYKNGSGCTLNGSVYALWLSLGLGLLFLLSLGLTAWICSMIKRHKLMKQRAKYFEKNGGLLLKEQTQGDNSIGQESCTRIFTPEELSVATSNYSEDRILGRGGYGMVYKGTLKDGRVVAIKKSKVSDQTQIEQFINEVVILAQINHRNVVKLLGCCLETEVPLLVYEYISHGTLYKHIHAKDGTSWLNWPNCIRVASEAADAFAYLHSEASIPIFHRDIKSANILLDESNTTKIADFGASRLIPVGYTEVTTLVQGTIGYLDPEYLLTSQLTDKSDVYSFGVVLTELLTKNRPISLGQNLSNYFVLAMKEDKLLEVIDPRFLQEASQKQLYTMANLIKRCLSVRGEDRPTMKEVAIELQGLKRQIKHLLGEQKYEPGSKYVRRPESSNGYNPSTAKSSGQYSQQRDMIIEMSHPR